MSHNVFEADKLREMQGKHPDWIWNRADTHVLLGVPGCPEAFKTPVEPGNSFSPGPGTYGVSTWIYDEKKLYAPETMPLDALSWRFEDDRFPVLNSTWQAGEIEANSILFTDGEMSRCDYTDWLRVRLTNRDAGAREVRLFIVLRSFGAAGGPIRSLSFDDGVVWINGAPSFYAHDPACAFGAVSYAAAQTDIGEFLKRGTLPREDRVQDDSTWASGALSYTVRLRPGESVQYDFACHIHPRRAAAENLTPPARPLAFDAHKAACLNAWKDILRIGLTLPDARFASAFQCQLSHLYMFTVDTSVRISPISYPIWWLRDGAYVLNALNKGGLHEFCAASCREVAHRDAFGGFGSEGDGPSQGIWILSEHYLLTRDLDFLREVFPHIRRKAELLFRMRRTTEPVRKFTEFVIPKCMLAPDSDLMCLPARDGLIVGRMDHHFPVYWINGFAYLAMKRAALCARALSLDDSEYEKEADEIRKSMMEAAPDSFGENDRDTNSAFWPCGWATAGDALITRRYDEVWKSRRCPDGVHHPVEDWTYFEAGQAHNDVLRGEREKAWVSIEWFLTHQTAPGLYTYPEGVDGNTALLWPRTRGWDDVKCVTPHGWTAAELFLLLRDCLIREDGEALVIGSGVPESWQSEDFAVENMPTYLGPVSFFYDHKTQVLSVNAPGAAGHEIRHELPFTARLSIRNE